MNSHLFIDRSTTGDDVDEWREALKHPHTWCIIAYQRIEPVYKLLDFERQQKIEMILSIYEQEKQRKCRCRTAPQQLLFDVDEGIYKYEVQCENKPINRHTLPSQTNGIFFFFYSPSYDQWFWKQNENPNNPWVLLKYTVVDELKVKSVHGTMHVLQQTNPIPTNDIIEISSRFENVYVPDGTVARLCKAVKYLFRTHKFPSE